MSTILLKPPYERRRKVPLVHTVTGPEPAENSSGAGVGRLLHLARGLLTTGCSNRPTEGHGRHHDPPIHRDETPRTLDYRQLVYALLLLSGRTSRRSSVSAQSPSRACSRPS